MDSQGLNHWRYSFPALTLTAREPIGNALTHMTDNQHYLHLTWQQTGGYQLLLTKINAQKDLDIKLIVNSKAPLNQAMFGDHLLVNERGSFLLLDLMSGTVLSNSSF